MIDSEETKTNVQYELINNATKHPVSQEKWQIVILLIDLKYIFSWYLVAVNFLNASSGKLINIGIKSVL